MFTVKKQYDFSAAHHLPDHDGKCAQEHGHNYLIDVSLSSLFINAKGPQTGMLLDFGLLNTIVKPLIEQLDHKDLNEVMCDVGDEASPELTMKPLYTTAENIAMWFWKKIWRGLSEKKYEWFTEMQRVNDFTLIVTVHETPRSQASFSGFGLLPDIVNTAKGNTETSAPAKDEKTAAKKSTKTEKV